MNDTALRKPTARRVVGMVAGIVIIALGIALFKQSHLGNDSISALNMRLAELLFVLLLGGVCSIFYANATIIKVAAFTPRPRADMWTRAWPTLFSKYSSFHRWFFEAAASIL